MPTARTALTTADKNAIIVTNIIGADQMKKSSVFLLVMSIVSFLAAAFGTLEIFGTWRAYSGWKELNRIYGNDVDMAFTKFASISLFIFGIEIAVGLILGAFGIIGSIKRGRFTVVCMVLGGLPALYLLLVNFLYLVQGLLVGEYAAAFVYCVLYTAAAAVAFKFGKAA